MASLQPQQRSRRSKNLTQGQIAAIITLRVSQKLTFPEIATELRINDKAAGLAFRRVQQKASSNDLHDLIEATNPKASHAGRPSKTEDGSEPSRRVRADIMEFKDYDPEDACHHVLAKAGISLSRNSPLDVMTDHRMAKDYIKEIWQQDDETMRRYMAEKLHPSCFGKGAEQLCLAVDGNNNFTA